MPESEYLELQKIILKLSKKIREKLSCGLNIIQNNMSIAHQVVPHVHFHLIPRLKNKDLYTNYQNNNNLEKYNSEKEKEEFVKLFKIK
jgi:histidine triad (HIT) family protein